VQRQVKVPLAYQRAREWAPHQVQEAEVPMTPWPLCKTLALSQTLT